MLRFLVDEDSPRSLALRAAGHVATGARDEGLRGQPDRRIFDVAQKLGLVLLTGDVEFGNELVYPPAGHRGGRAPVAPPSSGDPAFPPVPSPALPPVPVARPPAPLPAIPPEPPDAVAPPAPFGPAGSVSPQARRAHIHDARKRTGVRVLMFAVRIMRAARRRVEIARRPSNPRRTRSARTPASRSRVGGSRCAERPATWHWMSRPARHR